VASSSQQRFTVLAIGLGTSLPAADTAVNVALPAIAHALLSEVSAIRWTVIVYVSTYACLMMMLGAWGDRQGYLRVFRFGLWTGVLAYGYCSMASSYSELLIGRGLQGLSSALLLSVGPALMVQLWGSDQQERAVASYGALSSVAAALGPLIGGVMIYYLGWAGVFWFRLPAALMAMLCLSIAGYLARHEVKQALRTESSPGFAAFGSSMRHQCRAPILKAHALHAWAQSCGFTSMLLIPFLMMNFMQLTSSMVGMVLFAWPAGMAFGNSLGPRIIRLKGSQHSLALAMLCMQNEAEHRLNRSMMTACLAIALLLQGIGLGLFQMVYTDWVMGQSAVHERGVAGAASLTSRTLGVVMTAFFWPDLIELIREPFGLSWSSALGLIYLLGALSLMGLLSQIPRQSLRM
jgi:MFS family permease